MTAAVDSRLMTLAAPLHAPSAGGPTAFYSHLHEELARILATCGGQATTSNSPQMHHADVVVPGHEVGPPATDAGAAAIATSARQLDTEVDQLWRLDTSILRTSDTVGMLDAPPMLAPGPHVTGAGSAAVRLKQLRAAFVARSQQVNMAHHRYKCLSKHNDLYKTYVRVSSDLAGPPPSLGSPRSTVSPPPGGYSSHTSSASESDVVASSLAHGLSAFSSAGAAHGLATSSAGNAVHFALAPVSRASSFGGSDVAEMACHHPAASCIQQPALRRASPPPHAVPDSCAGAATGGRGVAPMDVDAVPLCGSACSSGSQPSSPTGRSASDAEVPTSSREPSPPLRARRGFLGLGGLFSRGRQPDSPPKAAALQQVPPTIQEEDCAVPEVRRSFSEPSVVGRRGALELRRESVDDLCVGGCVGFAMAGDEAGPSRPRRSRDAKRSGETLRSKSEPASTTRDSRRRRNFYLEDADEDGPQPRDAFSNPDLDSRVQIFSSEAQLHRGEDPDMYEYSRRRTFRV